MSNTQTRSEDGESGVTAVYCRVSKKSGNSRESGDSLCQQAELASGGSGRTQDCVAERSDIFRTMDIQGRI